ncbi:DUF4097 family beta strand repeat-containing protein [Rhodohalobacter halophilus]|uniref:DUF4097 family beta strand repeat-containing protein n=1 Tax=Rhodohalobacter halophilus TaxID=1812810 RepID=UPI00083FD427|nr:DUF4097 family beta strand repeat-containing protein [Rhodohalobacter halophilus]
MIRLLTNQTVRWFIPVLIIFGVFSNTAAQTSLSVLATDIISSADQPDPYRSEFYRVDRHPNVTINTISGDIEVVENSGLGGVQVDLYVKREFSLWSGTRNLDNYRIIMQKQGNSIIASVEDRRSGRELRSSAGVQFTFLVQVPSEASLNLRSIHGDISARGVEGKHFIQNHAGDLKIENMTGEIRAVSTAGDIYLNQLNGNIFAKTVSGDVEANRNSGEVRLRTTTGNITTSALSGTLVAGTTSGDIVSDFKEVSVGVYLETTTGDIDLSLPGMAGYSITASGMSLNFDELTGDNISKNISFMNASVEVREGEIPVNLKSVSGSVRVREN